MNIDLEQLIYSGVSVLFNVLIVVIGELLYTKFQWKHENARKFIHIGVCHWWIIASCTISDTFYAILPPILFIILNCASYKWQLVKSIERNRGKEDLGTVYYALSLFLLVLLTWSTPEKRDFAMIGILVLGYGDGLAAVIGKNYAWGSFCCWSNQKTISGCLAMFFSSFIIISLCLFFNTSLQLPIAVYLAVIATTLELVTPWGFDNITIPLGVTYAGIFI